MDFELTKENIQPLRGGRNPVQLGLALQAETNPEIRRELQLQREAFENAIRNYQGDDPLENWYQFISWIEQTYPKNGHEGNLVQLLEHCLSLFENDKRYIHDRRFCRLWIKYVDYQQNPLELYQMMHARGLSVGCADLYKAWAYYHEAAGDYKSANSIFELGKQALAQPYDELEMAHQNLVMAAGKHMLYGPSEDQLLERRQALTSLRTYKGGKAVGSVRVPAASGPGIYPTTSNDNVRPNAAITVYQDDGDEIRGAAAPPVSILTVVKRQEAPKENLLKPGPWSLYPSKKKMAVVPRKPPFTVHVDDEDDVPSVDPSCSININKPLPNFPPKTKETYVGWVVNLTMPEPVDNRLLPMYPKSRVYADPTTEYSLEELAALRYQKSVVQQNSMVSMSVEKPNVSNYMLGSSFSTSHSREMHTSEPRLQLSHQNGKSSVIPMQTGEVIDVDQYSNQNLAGLNTSPGSICFETSNSNGRQVPQKSFLKPATPIGNFGREAVLVDQSSFGMDSSKEMTSVSEMPSMAPVTVPSCNFVIWTSPSAEKEAPKPNAVKFYDHEQPRGSAMKTPFKVLSADDLAETGSRGSTDTASAAAQPMDSANIKQIFDEDSNSSFDEIKANIVYSDLNNSCNTQMFNFNLNAMKVSTPQSKQHAPQNCFEQVKATKKQLFENENETKKSDDALSIIYEESKSYASSSSSSAATTKSSVLGTTKPTAMTTISEEHNSYLAQNLMANEALRKSLLGDLLPSQETSPVTRMEDEPMSCSSPPATDVHRNRLDVAPSDPFKPSEIEKLLNLVSFPGPHIPEFHQVSMIPRISGKRETVSVGGDQYMVEKILGKGTFGTVYKAQDYKNGKPVALKYQKPANKWEFYICREIQTRLRNNPLRERFMDVTSGYFSDQASILVYAFMPYGSLLDLANQVKLKTGKPMQECLCFYFCIQMLRIVEAMHQIKIIHADIKPDNFLIQLTADSIDLQLIDFGCSIDMSLYPPNTSFTRKVQTESFICCEMLENKPWNYHTDLFCIAATTHVILFDKYIELQKKYDAWSIKEKFPRYMKSDLWNKFFDTLLNRQNEAGHLQVALDEALSTQYDKCMSGMKTLVNLIRNR
ncbi:mitotic checkpoint serine/threonine-protein kinase BUB1 beta-like isoform X2 [Coccinella septempunctata]|uniref:mitotic checkpoint serine/threonine-protein kinase BUB1 beta-like isoform X2 n=1 Tax=Coccinella septempunctata TaxID=41139 RepID=UPI001D0943DD|nr:mitotic checkpoint serine/threonine-protein kinase BUB1 beta-like isoform X2 [Coccinella septempunctata]